MPAQDWTDRSAAEVLGQHVLELMLVDHQRLRRKRRPQTKTKPGDLESKNHELWHGCGMGSFGHPKHAIAFCILSWCRTAYAARNVSTDLAFLTNTVCSDIARKGICDVSRTLCCMKRNKPEQQQTHGDHTMGAVPSGILNPTCRLARP